jgi:hypothetical protein
MENEGEKRGVGMVVSEFGLFSIPIGEGYQRMGTVLNDNYS